MSDIDLLPRADIPVLFNDFKCKADAVWSVVDSLVVTDVSQKEAMALARKTRLTLREIRIAVEHKRVELGEGHLKEIQKVNGAARAIKEFIEPLEARLLVQESFAERVEADRLAALSKLRFDEVEAINPRAVWVPHALAAMPQKEYDDLVSRLLLEKAQIETEKRLRIEAERKLAEAQAEAFRVAENARAERGREAAQAELVRFEQEAKHRAELQAANAIRTIEREAAEKRRQEDLRVEREKTAILEAELAQANAAKFAEEARLRRLSLAPDVERMRDYADTLRSIIIPNVESFAAQAIVREMVSCVSRASAMVENFCANEGLTKI